MTPLIGPLARTCVRCEWVEPDCVCPDGGLFDTVRSEDIAMDLIVDGDVGDISEARSLCAKHPGPRADNALSIMVEFEDDGWRVILGEVVGLSRHVAQTGGAPRNWP